MSYPCEKLPEKVRDEFEKEQSIEDESKQKENPFVIQVKDAITWDVTYEGWNPSLKNDYTTCIRTCIDKYK